MSEKCACHLVFPNGEKVAFKDKEAREKLSIVEIAMGDINNKINECNRKVNEINARSITARIVPFQNSISDSNPAIFKNIEFNDYGNVPLYVDIGMIFRSGSRNIGYKSLMLGIKNVIPDAYLGGKGDHILYQDKIAFGFPDDGEIFCLLTVTYSWQDRETFRLHFKGEYFTNCDNLRIEKIVIYE